jgi:hypothetical protein
VQQAAELNRVLSEVQSAADTKASSELNLAVANLSVGGGAGKTSACLAIQGKPLPEVRKSTRGGEGMALVVRDRKDELQGFEKPRGDLESNKAKNEAWEQKVTRIEQECAGQSAPGTSLQACLSLSQDGNSRSSSLAVCDLLPRDLTLTIQS